MATWTSLGHAMRRRMGAPSNHLEAAGASMSKNHLTPEEVIASAEHANSARRYVGLSAGANNVSGAPLKGTQVAKKNTQAADPTAGGKSNRANVAERQGAQYRITAKMPPMMSPEAGPTMASARIVPSVVGKQSPNFNDGLNSSY